MKITYLKNSEITVQQVRLIGKDGEQLGIVDIKQALAIAKEAKVDLVEIVPNGNPPVCKIIEYSKIKYEAQRKDKLNKKKQKSFVTKEVRFTLNIGEHDYNVKMKHVKEFIDDGHRVKFLMLLRGRQNEHKDIAADMFRKVQEDVSSFAKIESKLSIAGNQVSMLIAPINKVV
jgi:translation initiation factor IF-3